MTPDIIANKSRIEHNIWLELPRFSRQFTQSIIPQMDFVNLVKSIMSYFYTAKLEQHTDIFGRKFYVYGIQVAIPELRNKLPRRLTFIEEEK